MKYGDQFFNIKSIVEFMFMSGVMFFVVHSEQRWHSSFTMERSFLPLLTLLVTVHVLHKHKTVQTLWLWSCLFTATMMTITTSSSLSLWLLLLFNGVLIVVNDRYINVVDVKLRFTRWSNILLPNMISVDISRWSARYEQTSHRKCHYGIT